MVAEKSMHGSAFRAISAGRVSGPLVTQGLPSKRP